MTASVLRKELQRYIDTMPTRELCVLRPLLSELTENPYTVEAADAQEVAMIEECMKDYETDPSSWIPLESIQ